MCYKYKSACYWRPDCLVAIVTHYTIKLPMFVTKLHTYSSHIVFYQEYIMYSWFYQPTENIWNGIICMIPKLQTKINSVCDVSILLLLLQSTCWSWHTSRCHLRPIWAPDITNSSQFDGQTFWPVVWRFPARWILVHSHHCHLKTTRARQTGPRKQPQEKQTSKPLAMGYTWIVSALV